jgi:hypothetical protein
MRRGTRCRVSDWRGRGTALSPLVRATWPPETLRLEPHTLSHRRATRTCLCRGWSLRVTGTRPSQARRHRPGRRTRVGVQTRMFALLQLRASIRLRPNALRTHACMGACTRPHKFHPSNQLHPVDRAAAVVGAAVVAVARWATQNSETLLQRWWWGVPEFSPRKRASAMCGRKAVVIRTEVVRMKWWLCRWWWWRRQRQ